MDSRLNRLCEPSRTVCLFQMHCQKIETKMKVIPELKDFTILSGPRQAVEAEVGRRLISAVQTQPAEPGRRMSMSLIINFMLAMITAILVLKDIYAKNV